MAIAVALGLLPAAQAAAEGPLAWRTTVTPAPRSVALERVAEAPPARLAFAVEPRETGRPQRLVVARAPLTRDGRVTPYVGAGVGVGDDHAEAHDPARFEPSRTDVDPMAIAGAALRPGAPTFAFAEYQLARPMDQGGADAPAVEHRFRVGVRRRF